MDQAELKEINRLRGQIAAMRETLESERRGLENLIELRLLPGEGYEKDAQTAIEGIDSVLASGAGEPEAEVIAAALEYFQHEKGMFLDLAQSGEAARKGESEWGKRYRALRIELREAVERVRAARAKGGER